MITRHIAIAQLSHNLLFLFLLRLVLISQSEVRSMIPVGQPNSNLAIFDSARHYAICHRAIAERGGFMNPRMDCTRVRHKDRHMIENLEPTTARPTRTLGQKRRHFYTLIRHARTRTVPSEAAGYGTRDFSYARRGLGKGRSREAQETGLLRYFPGTRRDGFGPPCPELN